MNSKFQENTKDVKVFHLTFTGYYAGLPLCGCERVIDNPSIAFYHAVYAPKAVFTDERLCPDCLKVWNN